MAEHNAHELDQNDPLRTYRERFHFPTTHDEVIYLNGNSLGLQPDLTEKYVLKELQEWRQDAVEGHFKGDTPWMPYHELLTEPLTEILGAKNEEVVIMNTLTTNLHLMMVSFYRPTAERNKILVEYSPFPSDMYAVKSQIKYHGYDPEEALIELQPDEGEIVSMERIRETIEKHKDDLALIIIGGVNYYTGQTFDMEFIASLANQYGIVVGFDLAHAVGNVPLELHDWNVDFAVYCTYKYLNSGPGSLGGIFVHTKHASVDLPRFAGWWGHDKETRFLMEDEFDPIRGAEGWQLSNPPILSLAAIRASLDIFAEVGMEQLFAKTKKLTAFARELLTPLSDSITILTPDEELSGAQLSIQVHDQAKEIHKRLTTAGVFCDWREPSVIRVAFAPLYNSFSDVERFVNLLADLVTQVQS